MRRTFLAVALTVFLFFAANASSFAAFFFPGMTNANFWGLLYDPTTIATPTLWYKSTGVTLDTTLGQNTVSSWTNAGSGGTTFNWTQTTKTKQPAYITGGASGYPYLQFDGVDDWLQGTSGGLALCKNASSCTSFVVWQPDSVAATQYALSIQTPTTFAARFNGYLNSAGPGQVGLQARALDADTSSTLGESAPYQSTALALYQWQVDYTNKQGAAWVNATNEISVSTLTSMTAGNTSNTNANQVTFGALSSSGSGPISGKVYEVMLFENKVLTAYERSHIQNYFRYKYGIW